MMRRRRTLALGLLAIATAALAIAAPVAGATGTIVADSYTDTSHPGTNFGSKAYFKVDNSPVLTAYLKFVVSGYVPGKRALLQLHADSATSRGVVVSAVADTSWAEKGITANNAPALGSVIASTGPFKAGTWVTLDVSSAITGDGYVTLAVTTSSSTAIKLTSREGADPPRLLAPAPDAATGYSVVRIGTTSTYQATSSSGLVISGGLASVVESAVADLELGGGGTIDFAAGDFDLGADHLKFYDARNIVFQGAGMDATVLRNHTDSASDTEPFDFTGAFNVTVRDMTVSAGGALRSTSDALDFDDGNYVLVERVKVTSSRARGIIFDGKNSGWDSVSNVVRDCVITGLPSSGIELLASSHNRVEGCTITGVGRYGIQVNKSSTSADQPNKKSCYNEITGNTITQAGLDGIMVNSGDRNLIEGNTVADSSDDTSGRDGIRIGVADSQTAEDNVVRGNTCSDDQTVKTQRYGISVVNALCLRTVVGPGNVLIGNRLGAIYNVGTGTVIYP